MLRSCVVATALSLSVIACSHPDATNESRRQVAVAACQKEGDRCEFAPGKLGLCTPKTEGCTGSECLTCVSLH